MIFDLVNESADTPIIKVIGVGGGGSNAVNHMFKQGIVGVDFAICNTDSQAMDLSPVPTKIQLGPALTEGLGAGSKPIIGKKACEESIEEVQKYLGNNCKMLFVTAGMGGGTGTGAAPIIARTAQEMDILTVGIVTLPFTFEGMRRSRQGMEGLEELKKNVDTLIIISNDKLRQIFGNLSLSEAFAEADNILTTGARGIAEIITVPGYVNVDFEDVNTVMRDSGVAIMGTATAEGESRAKKAVDEALNSPLLEDSNIRGAQHILLNITSGTKEVTMDEIFEITEFVQEEAGHSSELIWGNCYDERLGEKLSVTVIATGFERQSRPSHRLGQQTDKIVVSLDESEDQPEKPGRNRISEVGFESEEDLPQSNTFEFNDVPKPTANGYSSYVDPYLSDEERERMEAERQVHLEAESKRRERLRNLRVKLTNPSTVNDLENKPAYLRRGVGLEDIPTSSEPTYSKWTISDDEDADFRRGNSYLHDNVD
ncbi:MAG: cell division protein FtsZ [Saprospiraceae bacterium]|nr:cell division protein FtsZ [Saprospiraceae bacterium]